METYPALNEEEGQRGGEAEARTAAPVPTAPQDRTTPGPAKMPPKSGRLKARPGYTCTADGGRMPLGPVVEFKIIDFGSSIFSATLAQATGGFRARANYQQMRALFEAKQLAYTSARENTTVAVNTAGGAEAPGSGGARWGLIPTHISRRVSTGACIIKLFLGHSQKGPAARADCSDFYIRQ